MILHSFSGNKTVFLHFGGNGFQYGIKKMLYASAASVKKYGVYTVAQVQNMAYEVTKDDRGMIFCGADAGNKIITSVMLDICWMQ